MAHVRLIGLLLFITAVILGLAAAATQTTHVRFSNAASAGSEYPSAGPGQPAGFPNEDGRGPPQTFPRESVETEFISVPVAWPLLGLSGVGLLLWFMQAPPPRHGRSHNRQRGQRRHR